MNNVLSIDLESFIHREFDPKKRWQKDDNYTKRGTEYILERLEKYNTKATFFVLGEIYEWYPELIKQIKSQGHEIGYHGHSHILLKDVKSLKTELEKSKEFIRKYKPKGFRAPRMYLKKEYFPILKQYGFTYDSS